MPAAKTMHVIALGLALAAASTPAQAAAWDYLVNGTGSYAGHSTGTTNPDRSAALSFNCNLDKRGSITIDVTVTKTPLAGDGDVTIELTTGDEVFVIEAVLMGEKDFQSAITWGYQMSVNAAAMAVFESDAPVFVRYNDIELEFAGANRSDNFETMLKTCGPFS